ncbi:MAG: hypothetical protein ACJAZK_000600 [Psychroserpens sp.]|jgi:hypothetical protein|uniref:hypothetical protein n=1 Tax=Psychroserpens sp. TaxID=2020870 RepID=UPI0039E3F67A
MKTYKHFLVVTFMFIASVASSQVGIGTTIPHASAALDVSATNKGFLPPRVASGSAVTLPATGLIIFNTTANQLQVNTGTTTAPIWTVTASSHYLGEAFDGGIIFYLYKGSDGLEHGLIVALTETTQRWSWTSSLVNANRTEDGVFNTNLMTDSPAKTYITGLGAGWYLPSIDELGLLYYNRYSVQKVLRAGGNTLLSQPGYYWSSTEYSQESAYIFGFSFGYAYFNNKTWLNTVRGVRAF